MVRSGIAAALSELAQGLGFKRSDDDLAKALDGKMRALRDCWAIDTIDLGRARSLIFVNLKAQIEQLKPRPARQGLPVEQRKKQFDNALYISFNIIKDTPGLTDRKLMERQGSLELVDPNGGYWIGIESCQRDFAYAIVEIERKILSAGYRPLTGAFDIAEVDPAFIPELIASPESDTSTDQNSQESTAQETRHPSSTRQFALIGSVVFALALGSGIAYESLHTSASAGQQPPQSPSSCSITACPAANVPSPIHAPASSPNLTVTFTHEGDANDGADVVFASSDTAAAAQFMNQRAVPADQWSFFRQEMKAGAYAAPGLLLDLNFESTSQQTLDITNIRPVGITRRPIATGDAVWIGSQGGGSSLNMTFDLDDANPIAKQGVGEPQQGQPFFGPRYMNVSAGSSQTASMRLYAYLGAYTFDIEVDYELDGAQYQLILTDDGKPFRITAFTCEPPQGLDVGLTQAQKDYLNSLHYLGTNARTANADGTQYSMVKGGPSSCHQ